MSKKDKTTPNVPTLRFRQYHDNWAVNSLSCIANVVGGGTPNTADLSLWDGDIQWFTPTEVGHTKYVTFSIRTISKLGLQKSNAKILPQGTILLSSRATVGACSIAKIECATNQGFQSLIPNKNINNEFLYYLTQTKKHHFIKYACGSTFLEISNSEIKKTKCLIPNFEEQQKIANFLSLIDNKIDVQNKIISKYESLIKGLCKVLCGKHKDCKLSDLLSCKTSLLQENKIHEKGQYPVYGANGKVGWLDSYQFDKDAILILKDGSNVGKVQFAMGKYSVVGTSVVLMPKNDNDAQYLFFAILTIDFGKYKVGSGIPHIYFKDYSVEKIFYPQKHMREYIVNLLSSYETKLHIEKEILSALQKQKAFFLKNIFI